MHEPGLAPRARCFPPINKQLSLREIAPARLSLATEVLTREHHLSLRQGQQQEASPLSAIIGLEDVEGAEEEVHEHVAS